MTQKYPGGFVTLTPPTLDPALGAATQGIWTLDQALTAAKLRSWPMYDPYYNNVVLNLHGDGTNGAQNNTFVDSSASPLTITRNGNTTQGTFSPYGQGWSNYFNGSSCITAPAGTDFAYGTGAFTVECWVYPTTYQAGSYAGGVIFGQSASGQNYFLLDISGSGAIDFTYGSGGGTGIPSAAGAVPLNTWTHVALVREGTGSNQTKIYVNGVLVVSGTCAFDFTNTSYPPGIGAYTHGVTILPFGGYVSNCRVVKGQAVYTSNFTPSTVPLTTTSQGATAANVSLLTCQNNRFVDNSTTSKTISTSGTPSVQRFSPFLFPTSYTPSTIGGSGYFDSVTDYLSSTITAIGTNDFTIEYYSYLISHTGGSGEAGYFQVSSAVGGLDTTFTTGLIAYRTGSGAGRVLGIVIGGTTIYTTYVPGLGEWFHTAIVRQSNSLKIYVNGVLVSTPTTISTNLTGSYVAVGGYYSTSYLMNGYLSGFRVVNSAVYTAAFTVPTTPPNAITNTTLLLNYTNSGIYDNAMMNDLETVGNAQISTSVKKYGTGSMYFDGSGDQLNIRSNTDTSLGTGDFTVEYWVYSTSFYNYITHISSTRGANGFNCGTQAAAQIVWYANGAERVRGTIAMATNTWYHIAYVRSGGVLKGYVNGVQDGTTYTDSINYSTPIINIAQLDTGGEAFTGYIDDLRITKGVARYVANFTPPTSQLQDQ